MNTADRLEAKSSQGLIHKIEVGHQEDGYYAHTTDKYGRTWYYRHNQTQKGWFDNTPTFFDSPLEAEQATPFPIPLGEAYENHFQNHKGMCNDKCLCMTNPFKSEDHQ